MSTNIDLGKIKFLWRGNWSSSNNYEVDDVVNHDGSTWICIQNALGTVHTPEIPSSYWEVMVQGSDLATISGLTVGDIVYWDGNAFVRLPYPANPTERFLTANSNTGPEWVQLEPHHIQTVHYEHYNHQSIGNGGYYYWGRGTYTASITTIKANSYINLRTRIFGEPNNHNTSGRIYMAVNNGSTSGFNYLKMTTFGQQTHLKLDYYEASGTDYNSTPKQHWYETIIDTSAYGAGTTFSFRMLVHNGATMWFNGSKSSSYESAPSTLTLTELNNTNTTIVRTGNMAGSY